MLTRWAWRGLEPDRAPEPDLGRTEGLVRIGETDATSSRAPANTEYDKDVWGLERMRFRGALFSDALEMKAIADHYGVGEAAVLAVSAGCDAVLVCRGDAVQEEAALRLSREARDSATFRRTLRSAAGRTGRLREWAASKEKVGTGLF